MAKLQISAPQRLARGALLALRIAEVMERDDTLQTTDPVARERMAKEISRRLDEATRDQDTDGERRVCLQAICALARVGLELEPARFMVGLVEYSRAADSVAYGESKRR